MIVVFLLLHDRFGHQDQGDRTLKGPVRRTLSNRTLERPVTLILMTEPVVKEKKDDDHLNILSLASAAARAPSKVLKWMPSREYLATFGRNHIRSSSPCRRKGRLGMISVEIHRSIVLHHPS